MPHIPEVEFGSTRQVWLSKWKDRATPSLRHSFLTRDDAFSRSSATVGRTLRLGGGVNTSPYSTWQQTSWSGGAQQRTWNDELMYDRGLVDASDQKGILRGPQGWRMTNSDTNNPTGIYVSHMASAPRGTNGRDTTLMYGMSDGRLYQYDPYGGGLALEGTNSGAGDKRITCSTRVEDFTVAGGHKTKIHFGCANGKILVYDTFADSFAEVDNGSAPTVGIHSIASFGGFLFTGQDNTLWKFTTTGAVWSEVKKFSDGYWISAMCVFGARLWIAVRTGGNMTRVYASDGVSVTHAFDIPEFNVQSMVEHMGSLYISGWSVQFATDTDGFDRPRVYKYNNVSLTLLQDFRDTEHWGRYYHIAASNLTSWNKHLVMGVSGYNTQTAQHYGPAFLWMYDAEEDAIHYGSHVWGPTGDLFNNELTRITAITQFGQTIAAGFLGERDNGVGFVRKPWMVAYLRRSGQQANINFSTGTGFFLSEPVKPPFIRSSWFDADTPHEEKAWLNISLRGTATRWGGIKVYFQPDDHKDEELCATISHLEGGPFDAYSEHEFHHDVQLFANNEWMKGERCRYRIEFTMDDGWIAETGEARPASVDSVVVTYVPAPTPRRVVRLRVYCSNEQERLDGTANPLTTRSAMVEAIEALWADGVPVALWDPRPTGAAPTTGEAGTYLIQDFHENTYRVDTDHDVSISEVSLTLLEVRPNVAYPT
jgi:hypothetical protein